MFDIASLRIEGDATDLTKLVDGLDKLTAASSRYHQAGQRTKAVTAEANAAHRGLAADMQRLVTSTDAVSRAESAALRVTEARTTASSRVTATQRLELAAARELAIATRAYEKSQAQTAAAVERLRMSYDPLAAAIGRTNAEIADARRLFSQGAIAADEYQKATSTLNARLTGLHEGQLKGVASSKVLTQAGLNLSRQFADVGVSLAGGISPMMVLIQQGPQIADAFATAKTQGLGFSAVLRGLGGAVAPVLPIIAAVGAAVGVVVGAFGLFEREVDKNTKANTTWGQTFQATMNVIGKAIMASPIGDFFRWIAETANKAMDAIVNGTMSWLDRMVGFWGAAYLAIVKNWRQLPQVIGAIVVGAANNTIQTVEGMINASAKGINRITGLVGWKPLTDVELPRLKQASNAVATQFVKDEARISAAFKAGREKVFRDIVKETDRLAAAQKKGAKDAADHTKALKDNTDAAKYAAEAYAELTRRVEAFADSLTKTMRDRGLSDFQKAQRDLRDGLADVRQWEGGAVSALGESARLAADVTEQWAKAQAAVNVQLEKTPASIGEITPPLEAARDLANSLANAFSDVRYSIDDMVRSIKRGDIGGFLQNLQGLSSGVGGLLNAGAGGVLSLGSIAANAIGGKGGRAVGTGLGIAATGVGAGAFAGTLTGGAALTAAGLGGLVGPLMAFAGPLGIAAGALNAAAKLFNIGGKPSNKGAGYDLRTGAVTGNKRDSETEQAATSAGQAIQGIQDALKAAGIGITDAVTGLVIGTRDATQIYLQSGKMLTSAVGDSGAAVDTAMRALLSGATYVSEAQKKLVDSAVAAGKGFDAISEILAKYEAAQAIGGNLADQILQLTDPKAFDLKGVTDDIAAQRKAYAQLATDGFITADMLATINGQLTTLEGLRLNEVLDRYSDSVKAAADANAEAVEKAKSDVLEAYSAFADAKRSEIDALRQSQEALKAFRKELDFGGIAGRSPTAQLAATRREFERLSAMSANAPERVANLQAVSQAFIEASKAASPSELAFQRDIASVRRATEASEVAVGQQAEIAQQQLDAATAQLTALGLINNSVLDLATTMKAYLAATGKGGAANDNAIDAAKYLADNKDLGRYAAANGLDPLAFAAQHYKTTGQYEIAAGIRKFATGGTHPGGLRLVGEEGPELEATGPSRIYSARETRSMLSGGGEEVVSELRALRETVATQANDIRALRNDNNRMLDQMKRWDGEGLHVRGADPDAPVKTQAA